MKKIIPFLLFFVLGNFASAQITVSLNSSTQTINPSLFGLNGRSTSGPSWTNNAFLNMVDTMKPAIIRYPAGTQGNQWNWQTGTFIPSYGSSSFTFTIPMLVNGLPAGSKIIYMVNMVLPTAQTGITYSTTTDAILNSTTTLNAKITDILNAIEAFKTAGHLPDICELGNELYFSNPEAGVYANDPVLYMSHAKTIALAIKNKYPTIDIILCTTKGGTTSRDNWNNTVINTLNSDATFKAAVRGLVQHHYINANWGGYQGIVSDIATAKTVINEGMQYAQQTITDYNIIPTSLKLWVTEYGATTTNADGMWASGMRLANMTMGFMILGNKLENLTWHHITDDPNILIQTQMKLGPSGMAFSLLSNAMFGKTAYQKLIFSNMNSSDPYATLYGIKFTKSGEESILILNMDNVTYNSVNLSFLFTNKNVVYNKQYWSATPYLTNVYEGNNISVVKNQSMSAYSIQPFSISVITTRATTPTSEFYTDKNIRVYPTIFDNLLEIKMEESSIAGKIQILDVAGQTVLSQTLKPGNTSIATTHLPKGIYIVNVENEKGKFNCKAIKK